MLELLESALSRKVCLLGFRECQRVCCRCCNSLLNELQLCNCCLCCSSGLLWCVHLHGRWQQSNDVMAVGRHISSNPGTMSCDVSYAYTDG